MTPPKKRRAPAPEVEEASVVFIQEVLLNQMKGLLQTDSLEERYASLREKMASSTEVQIRGLARRAAEYWVKNAPNPLTKEGVEKLKAAAFDHAVNS
jgi:hypothetical protein